MTVKKRYIILLFSSLLLFLIVFLSLEIINYFNESRKQVIKINTLYRQSTVYNKGAFIKKYKTLEDITVLELSNITIDPDLLMNLPNLRELELRRVHMPTLRFVNTLKNLKQLGLTECHIVSAKNHISEPYLPLKDIHNKSLKTLHIMGTGVDCEDFGGLQSINNIGFQECIVKHLDKMGNFKKLKYFENSYSILIDLEWLKNISSITRLNLSNSTIGNLKGLTYCRDLQSLLLNFAEIKDWKVSGTFIQLKSLSLMGSNARNLEILSHMPNLTNIHLQSSTLNDLDGFKYTPKLVTIYMTNVHCKNYEGLKYLKEAEMIKLSSAGIEDLSYLSRCRKLKRLYLDNCTHLKDISSLQELVELEVITLPMHIEDVSVLGELPKLNSAEVPKTAIGVEDLSKQFEHQFIVGRKITVSGRKE